MTLLGVYQEYLASVLLHVDVVLQGCNINNPPVVGAHVEIKWEDGDLYGAVFRGVNNLDEYTVEFEDGSQLVFRRPDLWTDEEELPKNIKSRLVSCFVHNE